MESLRSVRVRQQGARARREPCPSRGSGQAQAVEPGGVQQYMAHHGRAVTRMLDLPAAVTNVYLEMDIALWPASSPFGQLHVVGPAVGHMGVALGQLSISASSRITHGPARCGRRGTRPGRAPRWAGRQLLQPGRPRTAWIGELTATGRSSSGQAGQPPALSGQTAFFSRSRKNPGRIGGSPGGRNPFGSGQVAGGLERSGRRSGSRVHI